MAEVSEKVQALNEMVDEAEWTDIAELVAKNMIGKNMSLLPKMTRQVKLNIIKYISDWLGARYNQFVAMFLDNRYEPLFLAMQSSLHDDHPEIFVGNNSIKVYRGLAFNSHDDTKEHWEEAQKSRVGGEIYLDTSRRRMQSWTIDLGVARRFAQSHMGGQYSIGVVTEYTFPIKDLAFYFRFLDSNVHEFSYTEEQELIMDMGNGVDATVLEAYVNNNASQRKRIEDTSKTIGQILEDKYMLLKPEELYDKYDKDDKDFTAKNYVDYIIKKWDGLDDITALNTNSYLYKLLESVLISFNKNEIMYAFDELYDKAGEDEFVPILLNIISQRLKKLMVGKTRKKDVLEIIYAFITEHSSKAMYDTIKDAMIKDWGLNDDAGKYDPETNEYIKPTFASLDVEKSTEKQSIFLLNKNDYYLNLKMSVHVPNITTKEIDAQSSPFREEVIKRYIKEWPILRNVQIKGDAQIYIQTYQASIGNAKVYDPIISKDKAVGIYTYLDNKEAYPITKENQEKMIEIAKNIAMEFFPEYRSAQNQIIKMIQADPENDAHKYHAIIKINVPKTMHNKENNQKIVTLLQDGMLEFTMMQDVRCVITNYKPNKFSINKNVIVADNWKHSQYGQMKPINDKAVQDAVLKCARHELKIMLRKNFKVDVYGNALKTDYTLYVDVDQNKVNGPQRKDLKTEMDDFALDTSRILHSSNLDSIYKYVNFSISVQYKPSNEMYGNTISIGYHPAQSSKLLSTHHQDHILDLTRQRVREIVIKYMNISHANNNEEEEEKDDSILAKSDQDTVKKLLGYYDDNASNEVKNLVSDKYNSTLFLSDSIISAHITKGITFLVFVNKLMYEDALHNKEEEFKEAVFNHLEKKENITAACIRISLAPLDPSQQSQVSAVNMFFTNSPVKSINGFADEGSLIGWKKSAQDAVDDVLDHYAQDNTQDKEASAKKEEDVASKKMEVLTRIGYFKHPVDKELIALADNADNTEYFLVDNPPSTLSASTKGMACTVAINADLYNSQLPGDIKSHAKFQQDVFDRLVENEQIAAAVMQIYTNANTELIDVKYFSLYVNDHFISPTAKHGWKVATIKAIKAVLKEYSKNKKIDDTGATTSDDKDRVIDYNNMVMENAIDFAIKGAVVESPIQTALNREMYLNIKLRQGALPPIIMDEIKNNKKYKNYLINEWAKTWYSSAPGFEKTLKSIVTNILITDHGTTVGKVAYVLLPVVRIDRDKSGNQTHMMNITKHVSGDYFEQIANRIVDQEIKIVKNMGDAFQKHLKQLGLEDNNNTTKANKKEAKLWFTITDGGKLSDQDYKIIMSIVRPIIKQKYPDIDLKLMITNTQGIDRQEDFVKTFSASFEGMDNTKDQKDITEFTRGVIDGTTNTYIENMPKPIEKNGKVSANIYVGATSFQEDKYSGKDIKEKILNALLKSPYDFAGIKVIMVPDDDIFNGGVSFSIKDVKIGKDIKDDLKYVLHDLTQAILKAKTSI